jgi:hypothetical protein
MDKFYWVAVASWGGVVKMDAQLSTSDNPTYKAKKLAARRVVDEIMLRQGSEVAHHAGNQAVAIYTVELDEIDEVSLAGPQLMVRGQPVAMLSLEIFYGKGLKE